MKKLSRNSAILQVQKDHEEYLKVREKKEKDALKKKWALRTVFRFLFYNYWVQWVLIAQIIVFIYVSMSDVNRLVIYILLNTNWKFQIVWI